MKRASCMLVVLTLLLSATEQAMAGPTYLGTAGNASNWKITGAGATGASAFQVDINDPGEIGITNNGHSNGSIVSGGSLSKFNGFWYADETFTLPSNAVNVTLSFSGLFGDDRVVLELNGVMIGNATLPGETGAGVMSFPGPGDTDLPSPPDVDYTFTGATSGTVTTGFVLGGLNDLRLIVNNTGHGGFLTDPTVTFQGSGDTTEASVDATLTYEVNSVPEPSSLVLCIVCAGFAGYCGWRRNRLPVPE
jgi:hypothetical protein